MPRPARAVFVGDGSLLIRCADAFRAAGHHIACIASHDPAILDWARAEGLAAEPLAGHPRFEGIEFDYLFSVANLRVLPADLIHRAREMAINFHDGPLPRYAGLNATAWALMAGETRHGVTWHEMTAQVDRGGILRQSLFDLMPDETALSLNARCYEAGFESFRELVEALSRGDLSAQEQPPTQSYFGRHHRPALLGTLDWSRPASELAAQVRGLDFGGYANPLALPKVWLGGDEVLLARAARALPASRTALPGTVIEAAPGRLRVATVQGELELEGLRGPDGASAVLVPQAGLVLPPIPQALRQQLGDRLLGIGRGEAHWIDALSHLPSASPAGATSDPSSQALALPYPRRQSADPGLTGPGDAAGADLSPLRLPVAVPDCGAQTLAAFAAWLCAVSGRETVSLHYGDAVLAEAAQGIKAWVSPAVPITLAARADMTVPQAIEQAEAAIARAREAGPMTRDLPLRLGQSVVAMPAAGLRIGDAVRRGAPPQIELVADQPGAPLALLVDAMAFTPEVAAHMARHLEAWLREFSQAQGRSYVALSALALLPADEAAALRSLNDTAVPVDLSLPVHAVIANAGARQAAQDALCWNDTRLSHAQLDARATTLALALRERGVRPGDIVGLCLDRRPELVISVLAILKAGAAYLPLDPDYPRERLRYMVRDAGTRLIVCSDATAALLDLPAGMTLRPDAIAAAGAPAELPAVPVDSAAYVIHTSGSTGQPKGVVVTHANVLNFFTGMDQRVPHAPGARWLAVTSLSFDISVLELLWTLSRGITVVLHSNASAAERDGPEFSLFYFSSEESAGGADRYRLLMEGARFADQNGFAAVWTPERHFHAFGGLYPNPMITSAAIAAATQRVKIRAGSCVLPLHHPARVAEDWAMIDNLSGGRVGVSFAAGWQPNDFLLAPHAFADRKQRMLDGIDTVRALWRGETLAFPGHDGKPVNVRTLPRPVQPELPMWLTAAANPETFQQAGQKGCNVLTHLLGQTVEDVGQKVALFHEAWRAAGHAGRGQVTIMMHTFVGDDDERVREIARGPMKTYLRSAVDLVRQAAWTFPTFVNRAAADGRTPLQVMEEKPLSQEDMDALLDHAFARYWHTSALIGTPERCLAMVRRLQEAGVDEVACLIDFGIDNQLVLDGLHDLARLMRMAQRPQHSGGAPAVAVRMLDQGITHLQCTPSMATMLVADADGRQALGRLSALLVGGEALSQPLARQLRQCVPGKLLNMYGPTETTVWSTCCDLTEVADWVPLGPPIANTVIHIRNPWMQECPALVPGELLIGGAGVTRGYHGRPELTAQRFVDDPREPGLRLYRTGDLVRRHPDGRLEFLGRIDHQVKIRGHRIELGEIENTLARQPGVREAVVLALRDSAGESFLVGFVTAASDGPPLDAERLRQGLAQVLPEIMVPRLISPRASLPLTPNGKVDRKALLQATPATATAAATGAAAAAPLVAPEDALEQTIARIWREVLGRPEVGRESNFFDLGGHSLLVIQVQRRLKEAVGQEISITDMFRLPTIAAIADHLRGQGQASSAVADGRSRAQARRALRGQTVRAG
ncbi:MAG: MupA/Atu3671 family FMN-dependent luciferase-like monooxygenase [Pseudomonadota bacterium]